MTKINKWLCKTFDTDKKGYVIIRDIFSSEYGFMSLFTIPLSFMIGQVHYLPWNEKNIGWEFSIRVFLFGYGVILSIIGSIILLYLISNIKIARCPLNKEDAPCNKKCKYGLKETNKCKTCSEFIGD